jgi:hypothetical protein
MLLVQVLDIFDDEFMQQSAQALVMAIEQLHQEHNHLERLHQPLCSQFQKAENHLLPNERVQSLIKMVDQIKHVLDEKLKVVLIEVSHLRQETSQLHEFVVTHTW